MAIIRSNLNWSLLLIFCCCCCQFDQISKTTHFNLNYFAFLSLSLNDSFKAQAEERERVKYEAERRTKANGNGMLLLSFCREFACVCLRWLVYVNKIITVFINWIHFVTLSCWLLRLSRTTGSKMKKMKKPDLEL